MDAAPNKKQASGAVPQDFEQGSVRQALKSEVGFKEQYERERTCCVGSVRSVCCRIDFPAEGLARYFGQSQKQLSDSIYDVEAGWGTFSRSTSRSLVRAR